MGALHVAITETLPDLVRWLPWARPGHTRTDTRRYLRGARFSRSTRTAFEFVIEEHSSAELIGIMSLHRIDWARRSAGVGYWVRQSRQKNGFATEAASGLIEHGFAHLLLNRLELQIGPDNQASQKLAAVLGFHREGISRESEWVDGAYRDHIQYSLLRREVFPPGSTQT